MNTLLQCLSHTPLKGFYDPAPEIVKETRTVIDAMASDLEAFQPEVIFLFAPDHYNGFFLDTMPQLCIGISATAVGDYGSAAGPLNVPREIAEQCAAYLVDREIDLAISYRMQVDHGFAQPLEELAGGLAQYPVIPLFINSVAPPVISMKRARLFGDAIGQFAATLGKRVAFIGSGGLSHNPPVPLIATAAPDVAERIIAGHNPSADARNARQERTINAARSFTEGTSNLAPLNPEWDQKLMDELLHKDWEAIDAYSNDGITRDGGASGHEVKAWVAASAAMYAVTGGKYQPEVLYYRAIKEWISGFGAMTGRG